LKKKKTEESEFNRRFSELPGAPQRAPLPNLGPIRARCRPHPEYDLLWFIAQYAPELEQWERDIFLMVRASRSTSIRCSPARS